MVLRHAFLGLAAISIFLPGCTQKNEVPSKEVRVSFTESIKPILSNKCTICHNTQVLPKRPNFETREGAMESGVIVPGKPEASRILTVIKEDPQAEKAMPPVSHRLTKEEISLLHTWIAEGASWPSGEAGRVKPAFIPEE
jgi:uncharacterized membrane protein